MLVDSSQVAAYANQHALYIQTVVSLPHTDVRSTSNVCRQLIRNPQSQTILPLGSSNDMLIQGPGPWVNQITQILHFSDQARLEQTTRAREDRVVLTEVIRLDHADPEDLVAQLGLLYPPDAEGKARIETSVDPRTNSILLRCKKSDQVEIKALITKLDVE
jgi:type II secretory pathway component GspD/PulD (secretin)